MCVNPPAIVTIVWWWPSQLSHTVSYCNPYIPLDPGCDSDHADKMIMQSEILLAPTKAKGLVTKVKC